MNTIYYEMVSTNHILHASLDEDHNQQYPLRNGFCERYTLYMSSWRPLSTIYSLRNDPISFLSLLVIFFWLSDPPNYGVGSFSR